MVDEAGDQGVDFGKFRARLCGDHSFAAGRSEGGVEGADVEIRRDDEHGDGEVWSTGGN